MHKGWFVLRAIGSLILLVVLVVGGIALFNAGYSQGVVAASASAGAAPSTAAPVMPYGPYGYYHPMFFPGFLGFGFLIPLLLLGFVFFAGLRLLFFRPMMWHGYGGRHFGPMGPMGPMAGRCDPQEMEHWRQEWQKWHEQAAGTGEKTEAPARPSE